MRIEDRWWSCRLIGGYSRLLLLKIVADQICRDPSIFARKLGFAAMCQLKYRANPFSVFCGRQHWYTLQHDVLVSFYDVSRSWTWSIHESAESSVAEGTSLRCANLVDQQHGESDPRIFDANLASSLRLPILCRNSSDAGVS